MTKADIPMTNQTRNLEPERAPLCLLRPESARSERRYEK